MEAGPTPRELALVAAGEVQSPGGEQIRRQASQLAGHLRAKQQQIDHREAQLNARIALLEREVRTSRIWCAEREHGFRDREQELEREILELKQRVKAFSASEVSADMQLDEQRAVLRQSEADLDAREHRLCAGQLQLAEQAESLRVATERMRAEQARHQQKTRAARQQLECREAQIAAQHQRLLAQLEQHRGSLEQREARLDRQRRELGLRSQQEIAAVLQEQQDVYATASALLDEQTRLLQYEREQFARQQADAKEELRQERELFEQQQQKAEQDFARLRQKLSARQATLDQRRVSLEQMKSEVFELHRESIETRMIAEQLWQHVAKGKPVAELTQSLSGLRAKLVDEFRAARDEVSKQQQQLRELAASLNQRQRQLKQQQTELNQWLERRNEGIEEQAARLVARELELDTQQQELREREAAWRAERIELQAHLRQLTREWRPNSTAAA